MAYFLLYNYLRETKLLDVGGYMREKPLVAGSVKYKARLVAQGFTQVKDLHYDEVFVPMVRADTVRLMLTLAASRGYQMNHFDLLTAYLNAHLGEELYMTPKHQGMGVKLQKL